MDHGVRGGRGGRRNGRGGRSTSRGRSGGRGRGAGRQQPKRGGGRGQESRSSALPNRTQRPADTSTQRKNGEKGANANQVSEEYRIRLSKLMLDFREDETKDSLNFPPTLTNTERKFVHLLASQLGLKSKSTGKDADRHITITRIMAKNTAESTETLPILQIGPMGQAALQRHVAQYPPTPEEAAEARETGSTFLTSSSSVLPPSHDHDPSSRPSSTRTIDLNARRRNHTAWQQEKLRHASYAKIQRHRSQLPALAHEQEIVSAVTDHSVVIIAGETGCGKSTQVPQFLLDHNPAAKICVTQPRRLAAMAIAERVATEQCHDNHNNNALIGYQVRLESTVTARTQLLFCTPGVLLQQLRSSPTLHEYTHIVLDEVHERDKYQEFLLVVLRDLLPKRPDLRLVLMSATLATMGLVEYFAAWNVDTAIVTMEGRMFPVQDFFLEDILAMTGYLDGVIRAPRDGADGVGGTAPLLLSEVSMQCAMCGKSDFTDAGELGLHIALCDGVVDHEEDPNRENGEEKSELDQFADADGSEMFEEYDIDGTAEAAECSVVPADISSYGSTDPVVKWDGKDPFEFTKNKPEPQTELDRLLEEYQTMHDDETIDYELLVEILKYIINHGDGGVLVFLPGWQEISELSLILEGSPPFNDRRKYIILTLHSGIPSRDQKRVLQSPPPGTRKIVLSTNIAETSLTIDDIVFVVDTGRAKVKSYDPHLKTSTLQPAWISQASAKQRKGRAGRVTSGICFRLFSTRRHESMDPFTESELLRTPLEEMCLMCKKLHLTPGGIDDDDGIPAFLNKAMSAPHEKSVNNAIELLVDLGAMEPESNELTALGECLSQISCEPRVGKMVLWSYLLGCTRVATNMAVAMSYKSPFVLPKDTQRRAAESAKVQLSQQSESDQITVHYALEMKQSCKSSHAVVSFCQRNYINQNTLQMVADLRKNLARELTRLGFNDPYQKNHPSNAHDKSLSIWYGVLAAGLYPNVAFRRGGQSNFTTMSNQKMKIHVSSVNAAAGQPLNSKCRKTEKEMEFLCFGEIVKGARLFTANQTTHVSPMPLLLLCGKALCVRPDNDGDSSRAILSVDDWISLQCDADDAANIVVLRKRLESAFWRVVARPGSTAAVNPVERDALQVACSVMESSYSTMVRR